MADERAWTATWLKTGRDAFAEMLAAIERATRSICLETYICDDSDVSRRFRAALIAAIGRGVRVRVLIDAFGSLELRNAFWQPLVKAGGAFRWFNPLTLNRLAYRNHRKLLVCDGNVAFIGGYNISSAYDGDGVSSGWRDLGLRLTGDIVSALAESFELLFAKADFKHRLLPPLRRRGTAILESGLRWKLLLNIPSFRHRAVKRTLVEDLRHARSVCIESGYFLPTWRIRHRLLRLARSGVRVRLILAGRSDVWLAQLAGRRLYEAFMKAGVEIYEYQPQILHAKLVVIDDTVYAGSCNLDLRSLNFNYELMVRMQDASLAAEAREMFEKDLENSRRIDPATWRHERNIWTKWREDVAHFLLTRIDPFVARWQLKLLR
ncbi:MAG: phosphatidylserine/phosphatidylglycerophosphate/cardiolipin synthase family protein [Verrucomicrobia bacterium]|nr:phosphatidylserine/phosphatidylglycerophosphate/cardiolipin synthase family protein [Verrucomicrobiota bacterium]MBI3868765.1 phosphatidylserine/phosphatidylglycerophosphate/cardiolipin synthase family protein [Verrucomicrobiota bacterium]